VVLCTMPHPYLESVVRCSKVAENLGLYRECTAMRTLRGMGVVMVYRAVCIAWLMYDQVKTNIIQEVTINWLVTTLGNDYKMQNYASNGSGSMHVS
jgi:hypothetical protein